jgi:signal transduction histidine kinase
VKLPRLASGSPGRSSLDAESLRWIVGFLCALLGALVLVAPHRFSGPGAPELHRGWWGVAALLAGVLLLAVAAVRPRREARLLVHALAGSTLLALAASFAVTRTWMAAFTWAVLGLGTALAGFLATPDAQRQAPSRDLFALLMGVVAAGNGLLLLAWPALQAAAHPEASRRFLSVAGALLLLGGGLLAVGHGRRTPAGRFLRIAHLIAGAGFFAFGAVVSLPEHAWTALAVNWGFAGALALLPWLSRHLAGLDSAALRSRLSLILATATSLALIAATAVVTEQEERLAERQALISQRVRARAIARNVSDYIEMNGARTVAIAALAGRAPLTPESQARLLTASRRSYPDVTAFSTVGLDGRLVATAGGAVPPPPLLRALAAEIRVRPQKRLQLSPAEPSLFLLTAPIQDGDAAIVGVLVTTLDSEALARRIAQPGLSVSLGDGFGRLIASRNGISGVGEIAPLPAGWDHRIRAGRPVIRPNIAGFGVVPGLGWVVAVERPREDALAGVRRGRDLAFLLLLVLLPLAIAGGILAARRITRPLGNLSRAVGELSAGNLAVPVAVNSSVTEVSRLAGAFREMRDRLAERTREGERLAAELRERAETLAEIDRRKDEFLAMLAHELRNPLGAIANASYLLEQLGPKEANAERAVAIIRRQIQHLVRMIDDLLDVSRITRGKVELRRERLDLGEVVRHAVETTRLLAEAKQQTLRAELTGEPLPLYGDATRLEQVLSNLLRNAVKFTGPGGTIEVSAHRNGGADAVVLVRDDGIGITPALLPRVFDLFTQGEQALDRSGAGLGIGLTLVRNLVERHGGRIEARSAGPGKGSEFEVRLPLA